MKETVDQVLSPDKNDIWYVAEGSAQTIFEYGEAFNYSGIVAIHELNGYKTEYSEKDLYIKHIPELIFPGEYDVSVEVIPQEITFTYTVKVNEINLEGVFKNASLINVNDGKDYILELEDIDLSHIGEMTKITVYDSYANGEKYIKDYGNIGAAFGFKVYANSHTENAKLVLRMANYAVTPIYPARNLAIFQNYKSIDDNKRLTLDPDLYLTTRAPMKNGSEGADNSLVWCDISIDNVTLTQGENTFMFTVIGKEAPYLDCVKIILDTPKKEENKTDKAPTIPCENGRRNGRELAQKVVENGAVLLRNEKNENGIFALPLNKNEKVNVFGFAGTDKGFIIQGTGSGSGTRYNTITFLDALGTVNIPYNKALAKKYRGLDFEERKIGGEAGVDEAGFVSYYGIAEASPDFLDNETIENAKSYSDTAIIVIGRLFGEGNDYSKYQYLADGSVNKSRKMLSLSENEESLIKTVRKSFEKVIVILNSPNPMECGFAEEYNIDALVWLGYPGSTGAMGLANLLVGKKNFSGRLPDIYAYDHSSAASFANSGREGIGEYTDASDCEGIVFGKYHDYAEGIYVGYKWYETADAEGYWDNIDNKYGKRYQGVVQYPFGYGLSYTDFTWTVIECNYKNGDIAKKDGEFSIKVRVKNTSAIPGADVVQLYYSAPYTKGGIEKSAINLGAFVKTSVLGAGEEETVTLNMSIETMKSYDCYDKNNNGFMGYELEAGEYILSIRTDSHTLKDTTDGVNTFTITVPDGGYRYELDNTTQKPVFNQFTNYKNNLSGAQSEITHDKAINRQHSCDGNDEDIKITYLSRENFRETFTENKAPSRAAGEALVNDTARNYAFEKEGDLPLPKWGSSETTLSVDDMIGIPFNDDRWDKLTSQLTLHEAAKLVAAGGFGTVKTDSVNIPRTRAFDGPSGFNIGSAGTFTNFPCSTLIAATWDVNLTYKIGKTIAEEGTSFTPTITGWYGPGANIHRSPMGGRNFEYYSEDPVLSGIICAHHVLGAKRGGVTSYIKHIAVNDCERYRGGVYKWLSEQTLREIYLLPFEYAVKLGGANGLMASVDKVGSGQATSNSALLTAVLRNEWGFLGTVITDYYQGSNINDVDECVRAGCNLMLCPWGDEKLFKDIESPTAQNAIFKAAKEILYTYADTLYESRKSDL